MTRSTASLFMPVLVLIAMAAVLFLKPWNHTSVGGPALPVLAPAVTPAQPAPVDHSRATKLSASELEVLLHNETYSSTGSISLQMHWSCLSDPSGHWDYTCLLRENDSVWGYDVDSSQITSRSELSWEGHKLSP